jgi:hypothetical protein
MKMRRPLWCTTCMLCGLISMGLAPLGKADVVDRYSGATFTDFSGANNNLAKTPSGGNTCSPMDEDSLARYSGNPSACREPDPVPEPQCTAQLAALLVVLAFMLRRKSDPHRLNIG